MTNQDESSLLPTCDYEEIEEILAEADCDASAAEIQGFFSGIISAGGKSDDKDWQGFYVEVINEGQPMTPESAPMLAALYLWTAEEMAEHQTLAPMMLPDDGYPAVDQLEALVDWCQGFLLGFGLQTDIQTINNREVSEALGDLSEICRLELAAEDDNESQEAIMTLIEHVKVATQIIHWEMGAKNLANPTPDKDSPTIH